MQNLPIETLYRNALTVIGEQQLENRLLYAELSNARNTISTLETKLAELQPEESQVENSKVSQNGKSIT